MNKNSNLMGIMRYKTQNKNNKSKLISYKVCTKLYIKLIKLYINIQYTKNILNK